MPDLLGKVLSNRYRVEEFLGRGGMAEVYKVWDLQRSVYLAAKVLHSDLAQDKIFLRRFTREAQTLSSLQHPNIVRLYGLEQDGRIAFMLVDYIEGHSLRQEIFDARGQLPMERIMEVMRATCAALSYAHKQGFVHCDIKPANILIDKGGRVLVTDFGISRMMDAATSTMIGAGTPAYMAPEQVLGRDPTPQTDIYTLGILLFEMLTGGERPFTGEKARVTGATSERVRWEQLNLEPPTPRSFNPNLPPGLVRIVMQCLDKDPSRRFKSSIDLLNAVSNAVSAGGARQEQPVVIRMKPAKTVEQPRAEREQPPEPEKKVPVRPSTQRSRKNAISMVVLLGVMVCIAVVALGVRPLLSLFKQALRPVMTIPSTQDIKPTQPQVIPSAVPSIMPTQIVTQIPTQTRTQTPTGPSLGIGSSWTRPADGITMMYIPAGSFIMGSYETALDECNQYSMKLDSIHCRQDWFNDEFPSRTVTLKSFWMDQTEVTNRMYALCVETGKCNPPLFGKSAKISDYFENPDYQDFPVLYVSWSDAAAYCGWAGQRLPTEAEWEKAARGVDGNVYPWGNDKPDELLMNFNRIKGDTTKVGSYPQGASIYKLLDMAGNVWEWVNDLYSKDYYALMQTTDPTGPTSGNDRVLRGGSWNDNEGIVAEVSLYTCRTHTSGGGWEPGGGSQYKCTSGVSTVYPGGEITARAAFRFWRDPATQTNYIGFRCAGDVSQ